MNGGAVISEWVRYQRLSGLEAMHARFDQHVYHRHSHETYSFGVTERGAQAFTCRGARHTSAAGMVMAFNPDDPHDGHAADAGGFTYRIVHVPSDVFGYRPLFAAPVVDDAPAAQALRRLHVALMGPASALERDERLAAAVGALGRLASGPFRGDAPVLGAASLAARIREHLRERYLEDLSAADLATLAGCSRFALHRAFRASYGMTPADYQRQLRLADARLRLAAGGRAAAVAAETGFADQAHLTRWFLRYYGMTPGAFRRAGAGAPVQRRRP